MRRRGAHHGVAHQRRIVVHPADGKRRSASPAPVCRRPVCRIPPTRYGPHPGRSILPARARGRHVPGRPGIGAVVAAQNVGREEADAQAVFLRPRPEPSPQVFRVERFAFQARCGQDERLRQVVIVRLFRSGLDFTNAVRVVAPDSAARPTFRRNAEEISGRKADHRSPAPVLKPVRSAHRRGLARDTLAIVSMIRSGRRLNTSMDGDEPHDRLVLRPHRLSILSRPSLPSPVIVTTL